MPESKKSKRYNKIYCQPNLKKKLNNKFKKAVKIGFCKLHHPLTDTKSNPIFENSLQLENHRGMQNNQLVQ